MYATVKSPQPVYNDIFSDIFAQKRHQAYVRQERAEKRAKVISDKFADVWAVGDAELDKKIAAEAERRTLENAKFLDQKKKKHQELARVTREFQSKQMDEKKVVSDSDKLKLVEEYEKDKVKLE